MNDLINLTPTATRLKFQAQSASNEQWTITARAWGNLENAQETALLVHGLGAHSGWFQAFGQRLADRSIYALSYDQVGFGDRRNESFHSRDQWLKDMIASYDYLKEKADGKPVYLMGNSMGAVVALAMAEAVRPDALCLFSPGFDGHPVTFNLFYKLHAVIAAVFTPDKDIELPYTVDDITPSVKVREFLKNDPDRRFILNARMGLELLKLTQHVQHDIKSAPCPVFMATAGVEKIVNNPVSERIFQRLQAPVKQRAHFKEAWHDLMFDPVLDELVDEVTAWLNTVTNKTVPSSAQTQ